jgi:myo-inositol-1(or 4)-monophosphatase
MSIEQHALQQIIRAVGQEELLPRFARVEASAKADGSIVTEADLVVQEILTQKLQALYPGSLVLGEEMPESEQQRLLASDKPLWCLDPLDGTTNFAAGIPYFCISVALLENANVVLGLVYDPVRDELFHADVSTPAMLNGKQLDQIRNKQTTDAMSLKQSIALVDFKRLPAELASRMVSAPAYKSQRSFGSVALDWCWLASARVQVYLHGRANLWDYAAGQFIFQQGGGHSCTLAGEPVFYSQLKTRSCVGAINPALFDEWSRYLDIPLEKTRLEAKE